MRFHEIQRRYRAGMARYGNVEPSLFDSSGTTIAPVEDREGTNRASAYRIGVHTVVYCDPAVADLVRSLADATQSFPPSELAGWAKTRGFEFEGGGWLHLIDLSMLRSVDLPEGASVSVLDRGDATHRARIGDLVAAVGPDDADEADLDLDHLDPRIVALVDPQGRIGAYASERSFEYGEEFADIAIATHPEFRGRGWGSAAVSVLCADIFERGRLPLYRCTWDNTGSRRLALSLGFVETVTLAAMRMREAN
jgi:ribosomal protein S18 acetylase RimI-like enzyme